MRLPVLASVLGLVATVLLAPAGGAMPAPVVPYAGSFRVTPAPVGSPMDVTFGVHSYSAHPTWPTEATLLVPDWVTIVGNATVPLVANDTAVSAAAGWTVVAQRPGNWFARVETPLAGTTAPVRSWCCAFVLSHEDAAEARQMPSQPGRVRGNLTLIVDGHDLALLQYRVDPPTDLPPGGALQAGFRGAWADGASDLGDPAAEGARFWTYEGSGVVEARWAATFQGPGNETRAFSTVLHCLPYRFLNGDFQVGEASPRTQECERMRVPTPWNGGVLALAALAGAAWAARRRRRA